MRDRSYRAFRNALCLLRSFDESDLRVAGVITGAGDFEIYRQDPILYFLSIGSTRGEKLWVLIEHSQPVELRSVERAPS